MPAWIWFVIAVVAAGSGVVLLLRDRGSTRSVNRDRPRWAALRGWQYVESDPHLLGHWQGGSVAYFGGGTARGIVSGFTFTADGRRPVYVADQVHDSHVDCVLAAVRCQREFPVLLELWLPSVPFQRQQMPELLGPVGERYAFVSDMDVAHTLVTHDLVDAVEEIGNDITVVWLERDWVLAAGPPGAGPARLERLLRDLGELADVVDPLDEDEEPLLDRNAGRGSPAPGDPLG